MELCVETLFAVLLQRIASDELRWHTHTATSASDYRKARFRVLASACHCSDAPSSSTASAASGESTAECSDALATLHALPLAVAASAAAPDPLQPDPELAVDQKSAQLSAPEPQTALAVELSPEGMGVSGLVRRVVADADAFRAVLQHIQSLPPPAATDSSASGAAPAPHYTRTTFVWLDIEQRLPPMHQLVRLLVVV
jgi:hypothetical protein